jgi:hypothetical protein
MLAVIPHSQDVASVSVTQVDDTIETSRDTAKCGTNGVDGEQGSTKTSKGVDIGTIDSTSAKGSIEDQVSQLVTVHVVLLCYCVHCYCRLSKVD